MRRDRNWVWSDLRFIARKNEFWGALAVAAVLGAMLGSLVTVLLI